MLITSGQPARTVVLVDLGGPGLPVDQMADSAGGLEIAPAHDLLLVGERWEIDPPPQDCLDAEARRLASFAALRGTGCDAAQWALDPGDHRTAVKEALADHGGQLVGALGVSFGAVRVAIATSREVPLILVTPAPPGGTAYSVARSRAAALTRAAAAACGTRQDCRRRLRDIEVGPSTKAEYELALALIGAARDPARVEGVLNRAEEGSTTDLRRNAYAATFRYGDGGVLGNLLGYRAQTCSVYRAEAVAEHGLAGVLEGVLDCGADDSVVPVPFSRRQGCVFVAKGDLVTPTDLTEAWFRNSRLRRARAAVSAHGMVDGAAKEMLAGLPRSVGTC